MADFLFDVLMWMITIFGGGYVLLMLMDGIALAYEEDKWRRETGQKPWWLDNEHGE